MKFLIITGVSGNLGIELLKYFESHDYQKIYAFGSKTKLDSLNLKWNTNVEFIYDVDFTNEEEVNSVFKKIILTKNDELFIVHTIGAYSGGKYFYEYSKDELLKLYDSNFLTSFLLSKYAVKSVIGNKGGSIVFISSITALEYVSKRSIYALSKNSLLYLSKIINEECKEHNFSANVIVPSTILTESNLKWLKDKTESIKWITPIEIAKVIQNIFENYTVLRDSVILMKDRFIDR